ncbi:unnamed protein product [Prorocentrum cordatum]|uniref:Glycoside hydrolase family 5 C-terminal domain-containing protein n=1 Tax=Prorocentrum cordatum TaxID=2364126 RepID=A0ABN9V5Q6_9DINO|nr:unnamed protein product [Polarella glacialis]
MEKDSLGASAARRAARRRGRAALEAALCPLVAARGAPGSWLDRERASRPALQRFAAGHRVPGVMRLRRNTGWHARRVPPGGFTAASPAALSWAAAGPRLGHTAGGMRAESKPFVPRDACRAVGVRCNCGSTEFAPIPPPAVQMPSVTEPVHGNAMCERVGGFVLGVSAAVRDAACVGKVAEEFAGAQVVQAPHADAEVQTDAVPTPCVTESMHGESEDADLEVAACSVAHPEQLRSSGAAAACGYTCARHLGSAEGLVSDVSFAVQGRACGGADAEEFMDAQVSQAHSGVYQDFTTANSAESLFDPEGNLEVEKLRALSRTYAQAIAGDPEVMTFDAETAAFELRFNATVASAPTEIYLNRQLHYPHGHSLQIEPEGCLRLASAEEDSLVLLMLDSAQPSCMHSMMRVRIIANATDKGPVSMLV